MREDPSRYVSIVIRAKLFRIAVRGTHRILSHVTSKAVLPTKAASI